MTRILTQLELLQELQPVAEENVNRHISMAALPGMYEQTITCSSLSKTYSMTGWRLGYLIGPERVIEAAKKVHDFLRGFLDA